MIHFLPVAINLSLLGLYVRRVSWASPWPTTNVLNALQFAAKIHETLMIASLVNVLLHHVRYRLLCSGHRGLPLGIITSPFRLLDITYLWSREFVSSIRAPGGFCVSETITIIIHVFLFALAAVLGPASAIIMIPRLGEWNIAQTITNAPFYSLHNQLPIYQVYMGAELSGIFPKAVTASLIPEACDYSNLSLPQTNVCPRIGLTDILQGLILSETRDDVANLTSSQAWSVMDNYNITVQTHNQALPTRLINIARSPSKYSQAASPHPIFKNVVDVTTSTDAVLLLTQELITLYVDIWWSILKTDTTSLVAGAEWPANFNSYAGDVSSSWKQPYVSSYCSETGFGSAVSDPLTFTFNQLNIESYTVTLDTKLLSTVLGNRDMGFIDILDLNIMPNYTPSAALALTSHSHTTLCLVKAHWIESSLSGSQSSSLEDSMGGLNWDWQGAQDYVLHGSFVPHEGFREEIAWFDHADTAEMIHLGVEWLKVLDRGTESDTADQNGFFDKVRRACLGSSALAEDTLNSTGRHPNLKCFAAGLGAGIAEGLSKVPYNVDIHLLGSIEEMPRNALTLSPWTSSSFVTNMDLFNLLEGNWTNSTLTPAQIRASSTRLDFTITQRLYGYNFSGITITLAFVVVFSYLATILIHVCVMIFGTSWSSRSWRSLGEFFVLGLQSPTPATVLNNTGAGVKVSRTWQARVSVQELEHGRRVGVVVAEPGRADSGEGSVSMVRPDWKYS